VANKPKCKQCKHPYYKDQRCIDQYGTLSMCQPEDNLKYLEEMYERKEKVKHETK